MAGNQNMEPSEKSGILYEMEQKKVRDAEKANRKKSRSLAPLIPALLVYLVLAAGIELLSVLSAICWVLAAPLAAVLCAFPVVYMAKKRKGPGVFALIGLVWCVITIVIGFKMSFAGLVIAVIAVIVSELIRRILGYGSKEGICFGYGAAALLPFSHQVYLWTDTTDYMNALTSLVGEKYTDQLGGFATEIVLFLIIIGTVAAGYFGARLAIRRINLDKKGPEKA